MGVRSVRAMRFIPPCSRGSTAVPLPGLCPAVQTSSGFLVWSLVRTVEGGTVGLLSCRPKELLRVGGSADSAVEATVGSSMIALRRPTVCYGSRADPGQAQPSGERGNSATTQEALVPHRRDGSDSRASAATAGTETPAPSLRPSAAPTPMVLPRKRLTPRVGEIGWNFTSTEEDFVSHIDPTEAASIGQRCQLRLHHIPAELKKEYRLEGLTGLQNLPAPDPDALHSMPLSPAVDHRYYRRNGSGISASTDLRALAEAKAALEQHRSVNRMAGLTPSQRSQLSSPLASRQISFSKSSAAAGRLSVLSHSSHHSSGASTSRR